MLVSIEERVVPISLSLVELSRFSAFSVCFFQHGFRFQCNCVSATLGKTYYHREVCGPDSDPKKILFGTVLFFALQMSKDGLIAAITLAH